MPTAIGRDSGFRSKRVPIGMFGKGPDMSGSAYGSAITDLSLSAVVVSAPCLYDAAFRIPGVFCDYVDDAIHGIGAPHSGARTPDDFDALYIFQNRVLNIPKDT